MASEDRVIEPKAEVIKDIAAAPLIGAREAPDVYIEGYQGAAIHNGVAKLNAFVVVFDPESRQHFKHVVARLTMPLQTLIQVHDALGRFLSDLESQGLVKRVEGAPDAGE
jgi:hypothetical protein